MSLRTTSLFAVAVLAATLPAAADQSVLAEIDDLEPGSIEVRGFELDHAQDVEVVAVGPESRYRDEDWADAWILDARSREVVWELRDASSTRRDRRLRDFDDTVTLQAGLYEVYYAVLSQDRDVESFHSWLSDVIESFGRSERDLEEVAEEARIEIRGDGRSVSEGDLEDLRKARQASSLVDLTDPDEKSFEARGFELTGPATVEVYAVGEVTRDGGYDYGWIVDLGTRRRVWTLDYRDSEPAGGASKNRAARASLELPAGRYAAFFTTDPSHSPHDWNALPPHDPTSWGLTLRLAEGDRRLASTFDYEHLPADAILVEVTRLRDGDYASHGFTLTRPADLRVFAVGEGTDREMSDFGWIVDARTREQVWQMDYRRTEHAGGAQKNRLVDEVIHLDAGSYLVAFATDGSHTYHRWNADPPAWPDRWGITLLAPDAGFDRAVVADYEPDEDPAILVRIGPVRDFRHEEEEFSLDRPTEVRIYAIGEGTDNDMYDYAWIEDAAGRTVWRMEYRETDAAGGADKNRKFEGTLVLEPGEYVAHYESDGSHSFADWNAAPPADPEGWGIQIARSGVD